MTGIGDMRPVQGCSVLIIVVRETWIPLFLFAVDVPVFQRPPLDYVNKNRGNKISIILVYD